MNWNRRSWSRLREIAEVLAHHGLLWILDTVGLSGYLSWGGRIRAKTLPTIDAEWPERVRLVLADLGPTYVKLGQLASIRPDVLPDALVKSLEHLQDDVPPFGYDQAVKIIERAWGRPLADRVAWLDITPLAAASIGQVHRARLDDGRPVVIKVRRPGIQERAESDFRILKVLAQRAEKRSAWAQQNDLTGLVDELVLTMRDELDFTVEAQNTDTARRNLASNPDVLVPSVIWDLTRPDVLVLESLTGVKVNDAQGLSRINTSPQELGQRFVHSLYQQIFLQGFFHADPHPGNVHVDAEGRLIFLDWGMVGMLSQEMRNRSVELVLGLVEGHSETVADALMAMGSVDHGIDRRVLLRDIDRLRRRYYETQLKDFRLAQAMADLFGVAQRHRLRIPVEYMLLAKTAVIADGVVRALDPDFSLLAMGKPLFGELLWSRINPQNWGPSALRSSMKIATSLAHIPDELERALKTLSRGEIRIVLEHKNLDRMLAHWEMLINRVAVTLLLCAGILGLALVVHKGHLDRLAGMPFGEYAFIAMLALGVWLAISSLGRRKP